MPFDMSYSIFCHSHEYRIKMHFRRYKQTQEVQDQIKLIYRFPETYEHQKYDNIQFFMFSYCFYMNNLETKYLIINYNSSSYECKEKYKSPKVYRRKIIICSSFVLGDML